MTVRERTCPYCETLVPDHTTVCPGCGEDVAGLLHLTYAHAIYYNEALELARRGERERARESLLLSLRLCPTHTPSLTLMARLAAQGGLWDEARAYASRARTLASKDAELGALLIAIDEAEAESEAAHSSAAGRSDAPKGDLAAHQRQALRGVLLGALLGAVLSELVRWLLGRPGSKEA